MSARAAPNGGKARGKGCTAERDYTALAVAAGFLITEHAGGMLAREAHLVRELQETMGQVIQLEDSWSAREEETMGQMLEYDAELRDALNQWREAYRQERRRHDAAEGGRKDAERRLMQANAERERARMSLADLEGRLRR